MAAVAAWLVAQGVTAPAALAEAIAGMRAEAFAAGAVNAGAVADPDATVPAGDNGFDGALAAAARALIDGDTIDATADAMQTALTDPGHADTIAIANTVAAMTLGAIAAYTAQGVQQVRWVCDADPCAACISLRDGGPYPIGEAPACPAHPQCRCGLESA